MTDLDPDAAAKPDSGIFGLEDTPEAARVVLLPIPWDATTSYRPGAASAPAAILAASRQVDLFDVETGRPYAAGIAMLPIPRDLEAKNRTARRLAEPILRAGGITDEGPGALDRELARALERVNALSDELNDWVYERTLHWLEERKLVGVVGGDHSAPFGALRAYAERHPNLGVLHVDAHADLRAAYEGFTHSHASIMHNVMEHVPGVTRLVQVGVRDLGEGEIRYIEASKGRIVTHFDAGLARARLEGTPWSREVARILEPLPNDVYVSFDIDGLDPALCPHTGTPVPGGLSFAMAGELLRGLSTSGRRIVGFDLCEVAPGPEGDEWDANVGARLLYKMIGWALKSGS